MKAAQLRLLVVEDDVELARWLSVVLAHERVTIEFTTNGVEAISRARDSRPHLILLDAVLPGMDGFEVFRVLRREERLGATRVIMMSGKTEAGALALAADVGAFAWLRKPLKPDVVRRKVLHALALADDRAPMLGPAEPQRPARPGRPGGSASRAKPARPALDEPSAREGDVTQDVPHEGG